ncbi:HNH endonuclease signature motif containing protein [Burkholderia vietnamiensis]|uniref:HNH endonuclease signature motif containing protein n=1 Tax=Burkholderia vietnamiensis TaxID=60552 RepID=UPI001D133BF5|nr:HNH endonuclease [Burkholderia vietnamiensis]UEC01941.1 hypothetical protein LK462_07935 [Burkholderia vietnamiensis]
MLDKAYTEADVQHYYGLLVVEHQKHLATHGVKLPPLLDERTEKYNNRALQLVYLRIHLRELVSREDITEFVRLFNPDVSGDQQPRHLAYDGWDVRLAGKAKETFDGNPVPNGFNVLASTEAPKPTFLKTNLKRLGKVKASDWVSLQAAYDHKCATCGEPNEGKLEKGHMHPGKPLEMGNIIPMCGKCNNWAGNRLVFDENGRVIALATPDLVSASDDQVQHEIYRMLDARFGKGVRCPRAVKRPKVAPLAQSSPDALLAAPAVSVGHLITSTDTH